MGFLSAFVTVGLNYILGLLSSCCAHSTVPSLVYWEEQTFVFITSSSAQWRAGKPISPTPLSQSGSSRQRQQVIFWPGTGDPWWKGFFFSFLFKLFYCCSSTVVCIFSPPLTQPQPNPPPSLASTLPLGFVHMSFIVVPEIPSPHHPFPTPHWLLLDCS